MLDINVPYWLILLISGVLSALALGIALKSRALTGAKSLAGIMAATIIWSLGYVGELNSSAAAQALLWQKFEYIGITALPPLCLFFAFTLNKLDKLTRFKAFLPFLIIPAIGLAGVWTNGFHHLFWSGSYFLEHNGANILQNSYGPIYLLLFIYSYLLYLVSSALMIYRYLITNPLLRYSIRFLFIPLAPVAAGIIGTFGISFFKLMDITPFLFAITGLLINWNTPGRLQLGITPAVYEQFFSSSGNGLIVLGKKGEVLDYNSAAMSIGGFPDKAALQSFIHKMYPGFNNGSGNVSGKPAVTISTAEQELDHELKSPGVLLRICPFNFRGKYVGSFVSLTDISQQKQVARDLEESKEHYETIFEGIRDAVVFASPDGIIFDANNAALELYGYKRLEIIGNSIMDITSDAEIRSAFIEKDDEKRQVIFKKMFEAPLQIMGIRSDGESFPSEVTACQLSISDEPYILMVVRNITEKVKAENRINLNQRLLQMLNEITLDVLEGNSFTETLQRIADHMGGFFNSFSIHINLMSSDNQQILPSAAFGAMKGIYEKLSPIPAENSLTVKLLDTGSPYSIEDMYSMQNISADVSLMFPAFSLMAFPLIAGEIKLGSVMISYDTVREFSEDEMKQGHKAS